MRDATWCQCMIVVLACQCLQCWAARPPTNEELALGAISKDSKGVAKEAKDRKEPCNSIEKIVQASIDRQFKVETYVVEHEISEPSARTAAENVNTEELSSHTIGCDKCSASDMEYCSKRDVIEDHCCCDGRYIESFPYIPHTCYRGPVVCKSVQSDCEEYARIRDCCCKVHLSNKWKTLLMKSGAANSSKSVRWLWMLPWFLTILINKQF